MWVSPFRDLRIIGYLLLPEAFRSLSRLSSALSAKASTICSFHHDQNVDISLSTLVSRVSVLCFFSRNLLGCLFSLRFFLVCGFQGTLLIIKEGIYSHPGLRSEASRSRIFSNYQMENTRFELVTSCLQGRRSPN